MARMLLMRSIRSFCVAFRRLTALTPTNSTAIVPNRETHQLAGPWMPPRPNHALVAMINAKRAATYRNVLRDSGLDVHIARDGDEAQQIVDRLGPPLLV